MSDGAITGAPRNFPEGTFSAGDVITQGVSGRRGSVAAGSLGRPLAGTRFG